MHLSSYNCWHITFAALPGSAASHASFMAFISSCLSVSFFTSISSYETKPEPSLANSYKNLHHSKKKKGFCFDCQKQIHLLSLCLCRTLGLVWRSGTTLSSQSHATKEKARFLSANQEQKHFCFVCFPALNTGCLILPLGIDRLFPAFGTGYRISRVWPR